jgi:hypothetical protein
VLAFIFIFFFLFFSNFFCWFFFFYLVNYGAMVVRVGAFECGFFY